MIETIILIFFAAWMLESIRDYLVSRPCKHPNKITYHSTGRKKCVDCPAEWDIKENNYAKHQR
jgi:hypothetical protein